MTERHADSLEFLHALGSLYCRAGHHERGLVFLLLAARMAPENVAVLHSLAEAFVETDAATRAIAAIDRIEDISEAGDPAVARLRSKAHWLRGQEDRARDAFKAYLQARAAE
ncbi:type III secretion protein [Sinorhizobium saheli]|uniref:Type III secretion protein n=1 Tax=Sinorhizobium saheli TaxID=36856 RepID=A0A178YQF9_SINSA|nr:type III secretion protein [Sinorhizobium saheli]MQW85730.1 type III secretion protein [Sinorhizobium saheli]OAP49759.1 type III secretion protein [Sinorhizobium saheli]